MSARDGWTPPPTVASAPSSPPSPSWVTCWHFLGRRSDEPYLPHRARPPRGRACRTACALAGVNMTVPNPLHVTARCYNVAKPCTPPPTYFPPPAGGARAVALDPSPRLIGVGISILTLDAGQRPAGSLTSPWPSGKAPVCRTGFRGFKSCRGLQSWWYHTRCRQHRDTRAGK